MYSPFVWRLAAGEPGDKTISVDVDGWIEVELNWDCDQRTGHIALDGAKGRPIAQQHTSSGPSYLRLALEGATSGAAPVLVDSIGVQIEAD
jgi:hypothetical protein